MASPQAKNEGKRAKTGFNLSPLYITPTSTLLSFLLRLPLLFFRPFLLFSNYPGHRSLCFNVPVLTGFIPSEERKMNHCGIHQNTTFASSREEMRSSVSLSVTFGNGEPMVCPKPRRLGLFTTTNDSVRPLRWQMCYQSEGYETKAGPELLDIIFAKGGGYGGSSEQTCTQIASSPPFFSGSPPSRVSNPLIQDALFGDDKVSPVSPRSMIPNPSSSGTTAAIAASLPSPEKSNP
ncbi:unnamed protein product [Lactuca virosa]|uniref:AT-hook motif nuclear-localized protein n=1 Tax=Lactuca virosa TaxID=75947 RepID=A0AAU9LZB0_9ASTR|nr:unnamed protein product [Lactuca virosa]